MNNLQDVYLFITGLCLSLLLRVCVDFWIKTVHNSCNFLLKKITKSLNNWLEFFEAQMSKIISILKMLILLM